MSAPSSGRSPRPRGGSRPASSPRSRLVETMPRRGSTSSIASSAPTSTSTATVRAQAAREVDRKRAAGERARPARRRADRAQGHARHRAASPTTAGSKILAGWVPPYDATVVEKLRAAGAILLGKVNCDEFAHGLVDRELRLQEDANPWDPSRVPGGSSGGSSAAVAAGLCAASLGTDTGGSIRQPAAFCGVVGIKPTYGRVSRWGVVAFASLARSGRPARRAPSRDAALVLEVIAGHDPRDATSLDAPVPDFTAARSTGDVAGPARSACPRSTSTARSTPTSRAALDAHDRRAAGERGADARRRLAAAHAASRSPAYYIVAPAEASSNLARYDGIRYGKRAEADATCSTCTRKTRGAGFGPEVKRRIMLGTYALRSGYYDAYYKKAQQVRALIKRDFDDGVRAAATCCSRRRRRPPRSGSARRPTPLDMYLADVFTLVVQPRRAARHERAVRADQRRPADRRAAARPAARRGDAAPRRRA